MITEITKAQQKTQLGKLMDEGKASYQQISMAKEIMLKWHKQLQESQDRVRRYGNHKDTQ